RRGERGTGRRGDGGTGRPGVRSRLGALLLPLPSPTPADETAALAADGKAYRQHLRAEVQRLAGILKSEAEASLLLKALPHAPVEALKELLASYQARVEEKFPPRPLGDATPPAPNASRPAPEAAGPERPFRFS